ncbi:hypothetical protein FFZ77_14130 [Streptomyces katsurahamanus]|uniref:Uncharacterized protein n=1 Tax=Streptomyces katsurahamanus TaxID=2577098 RepID=A0ABW9NTS2_9ACTN|nr:hypothetical protein [Streptomyces katsurahamanus]
MGLAVAPDEIPGIEVARVLQATAGAGFLLYCLVALGLLAARLRLRARTSATGVGPTGWQDRAAADRS